MNKVPKISVLIPVYNSAEHLRLCLNSLINQSFEDFEIIAVDNGSEDNSLEILNEYAEEYPEKFFAYTIDHSDFVGTGRNYALSKARGEYLYICDSDDIVEKHALTWLYARAEIYHADIIYGYYHFVNMQNNKVYVFGRDGEKSVTPGELILTGADYWRRLYKKSLIDFVIQKVGPIPENTNFDDVAWLPVVHSYAKVIRSIDRPIYNYFRRTQSTVGGYSPKIIEYSIYSEQYAMENCNSQYRDYAQLYAARRINGNLNTRWIYSDKIIEQIKSNWEIFKNNKRITSEKSLFDRLSLYNELPDTPMPKVVYINGFGVDRSDDYVGIIAEQAFDEGICVVLNEKNCDIYSNDFVKAAYENKEYKILGAYFALRKIYESGGIYITDNIEIEKPFNSLRYFNAFFVYESKTDFSEEIFGGIKGSEVIKSILDTFEQNRYKDVFLPMSERITNIVTVQYGVKPNSTTDLFSYNFAILAPSVAVSDICYGGDDPSNFHICSHNYKNYAGNDNYITLRKDSISALAVKSSNVNHVISNGNMEEELNFVKTRLNLIEHSMAYRLALKISRIGNLKFFSPLKGLIKKMVK